MNLKEWKRKKIMTINCFLRVGYRDNDKVVWKKFVPSKNEQNVVKSAIKLLFTPMFWCTGKGCELWPVLDL